MTVEEYLGDGVYAVFDGYSVRLDLRAQPTHGHVCRICLEPVVYTALQRFVERIQRTEEPKIERNEDR